MKKTESQKQVFSQDTLDRFLRLYDTKGIEKICTYFHSISLLDDFQEDVKLYRKKYDIPEEAFDENEDHYHTKDGYPLNPKRWIHSRCKKEGFWKSMVLDEFKLCEKYNIPKDNRLLLSKYMMYNVPGAIHYSLCTTQDRSDIKEKPCVDMFDDYPILIRVSPYAKLRDILDYVKIAYTHDILPLQKKYQEKDCHLGKTRKKNPKIQERNSFIFKNRNLPLKEIRRLLSKKGHYLDDGEIGKIKSLEVKKRKYM